MKASAFETICEKHNIKLVKYHKYQDYLDDLNFNKAQGEQRNYFDTVEGDLIEDEKRVNEIIDNIQKVQDLLDHQLEKKNVVETYYSLFGKIQSQGDSSNLEEGNGLDFMAGIIKAEDEMRLKRMIFRISRNRASPYFYNYPQDDTQDPRNFRKIFIIIYQSSAEGLLKQRILKILDIFSASRYDIPEKNELKKELDQLEGGIKNNKTVIKESESALEMILKDKAYTVKKLTLGQ